MPQKYCPYCEETKPLEAFYYRKRDGYSKKCKSCTRKSENESRKQKPKKVDWKKCPSCLKTKHISKFHENSHTNLCIECYRVQKAEAERKRRSLDPQYFREKRAERSEKRLESDYYSEKIEQAKQTISMYAGKGVHRIPLKVLVDALEPLDHRECCKRVIEYAQEVLV